MRSTNIRWLVGSVLFCLPAIIAVIGECYDSSLVYPDSPITPLLPVLFWISIFLAAVIPAALVMTTPKALSRRIVFTVVILCGLFLEFYLIAYSALRGFR